MVLDGECPYVATPPAECAFYCNAAEPAITECIPAAAVCDFNVDCVETRLDESDCGLVWLIIIFPILQLGSGKVVLMIKNALFHRFFNFFFSLELLFDIFFTLTAMVQRFHLNFHASFVDHNILGDLGGNFVNITTETRTNAYKFDIEAITS